MKKIAMVFLVVAIWAMGVCAGNEPEGLQRTLKFPLLPIISGGGGTDQDTTFFHSDFESGIAGWTTQDLTIQTNHWHPDMFNAYQGNSWWCGDSSAGGSGIMGYDNFWLQYMDSPLLDLSGAGAPTLNFMVYWSVESYTSVPPPPPYDGWDGCNAWISTNGGTSFTPISPITPSYNCSSLSSFGTVWRMGPNIPGWAGQSGGWLEAQFDLSSYTEDSVVVRFALASDRAVSSATGHPELLGFFLDNIMLSEGGTTYLSNNADDPPVPAEFTFEQGPPFGDWWEMTTATAYSPTHCMVVDDDHFYINDALISPPIALPDDYTLWFKYAVLCDLPDSTHGTSLSLRDFYFVDISDDNGLTWEQQFYDYARGYCYPNWGICAPDTPYIAPGNNNIEMDLTSWGGDTILIRFRCVTDGDHTTGNGTGLHIDDLWIEGSSLLSNDCGAENLYIPFPTSVNFLINCSVELHNYGLNPQNTVPAYFKAGSQTVPLAPWVSIPSESTVVFNFNWTPNQFGDLNPYAYTIIVGDLNPTNDTTYAGTVTVTDEGIYELGYDNREGIYYYVFDSGEGPLVKFDEPFTTPMWFTLQSIRTIFNGDLTSPTPITLHFYEGGETAPEEEFRTETFTIDPGSTYPNWWETTLSYAPQVSNYNGTLWVWLEITNAQGYPHPVGHPRVWGEGHYFNYDGSTVSNFSNDLMIRVTVVEGAIRVSEQPLNSPLLFKLNANYPNPFNSATEISFEIPYSGQVSLKIYDIAGRLVDIVYEGNLSAGRHKFRFFGNGLSSGVYLMELKQEDNKSMKKIVLVK